MTTLPAPRLRHREDRRAIAFVLVQLGLVAAGFLAWRHEPWALLALHVAATSAFAFFTAVIVHNTVHVPMFDDRRWNRAAQVFLSIAYGHPVSAFVRGHNLSHHRYTQSTRDVMRTTKARFRSNLLNQLLFFFVVAPDVARANTEYARRMKAKGDPWYAQYRLERLAAGAVVVALALLDWRAALLFLGVPRLWANWGIVGMNYLQHDGCDADHPYDHSRTFTGRVVNWWTFNNGYHGIHHQKPHVHWSKLPEVHDREYAPRVDPRLVEPSIVAYAWRAFVWPGERLDFRGRPLVLPPAAPDEDWMPGPHDLAATSRGAVADPDDAPAPIYDPGDRSRAA